MKTRAIVLLAILMLTGISAVSAAPQRIPMKGEKQKTKEAAAKAQIKNIDLRNIEDPATRNAIKEILNYLGLQARN